MEELSGGDLLPSRIYLCGGGSRLPEIQAALAAETFWKPMPFARPPEVTVMAPDQIETVVDATGAAGRPAGRDAARPGVPGDRAADDRGRARRRAAARAARDAGLTVAGRVIYLDVDDEITSAAARIRAAEGTRVAVVLPHGSRVATSRINFRLLARDAHDERQAPVDRGRRRGHAGAGGVGRVADLRDGRGVRVVARGRRRRRRGRFGVGGRGRGRGAATADDEPMLVSETVATPVADGRAVAATATTAGTDGSRPRRRRRRGRRVAAAAAAQRPRPRRRRGGHDAARGAHRGAGRRIRRSAGAHARAPAAIPAARVVADTPDTPAAERDRPRHASSRASRSRAAFACRSAARRSSSGWPCSRWPSSSAARSRSCSSRPRRPSITPREATVGPDTAADRGEHDGHGTRSRAADRARSARSTVPLEASDTFPATGQADRGGQGQGRRPVRQPRPHQLEHRRQGQHRQHGLRDPVPHRQGRDRSRRPSSSGSRSCPSRRRRRRHGRRRRTRGQRARRTRIQTVPRGEEPFFLKVTNPEATTGGKHDEFPRVKQEDVDAATAALTAELAAAVRGSPRRSRPPRRRRPRCSPRPRRSATPVFDVDPATLVGQEVETFELKRDQPPARSSPSTRHRSRPSPRPGSRRASTPGYALIDGSEQRRSGPGRDLGRRHHVPGRGHGPPGARARPGRDRARDHGQAARAGARDPRDVRRGRPEVWPDWVGTVPTLDSRVEVTRAADGGGVAVTRALGIDLGERRIGIAIADGPGAGARPLTTLRRGRHDRGRRRRRCSR